MWRIFRFLAIISLLAFSVSKFHPWRDDSEARLTLAIRSAMTTSLSEHLPFQMDNHDPIHSVQRTLTCATRRVKDARPGLAVVPDSACTISPTSVRRLCHAHAKKRILFVGPELTYHLHLLWLDALSSIEQRDHSCRGPAFCTFHHICQPLTDNKPDIEHNRHQQLPTNTDLIARNSSLIRYIMSSSLYASKARSEEHYAVPQMGVGTGVRLRDMPWIQQARKSDVVLLHRAPLPAPAWTYDGSRRGNWTFVDDLDAYFDLESSNLADRVINAALHATLTQFLPTLRQTLRTIGIDEELRRRKPLWIWHSNLYETNPCLADVRPELLINTSDLWALYHNAQGEY